MKSGNALPKMLKVLEILHYLIATSAIGAIFSLFPYTRISVTMWPYLAYFGLLCLGCIVAAVSIAQRKRLFFLHSFELLLIVALPTVGSAVGIFGLIVLHAPTINEHFKQEKKLTKKENRLPKQIEIKQ